MNQNHYQRGKAQRHLTMVAALLMLPSCAYLPSTGTESADAPSATVNRPSLPEDTVKPDPLNAQDNVRTPTHCKFHPSKGVAELKNIGDEYWELTFYPGDISFRHQQLAGDSRPGQEFRAMHYRIQEAGCGAPYFELLGTLN